MCINPQTGPNKGTNYVYLSVLCLKLNCQAVLGIYLTVEKMNLYVCNLFLETYICSIFGGWAPQTEKESQNLHCFRSVHDFLWQQEN